MDVSDADKSFFSGRRGAITGFAAFVTSVVARASGSFNATVVVRVADAPTFQVPISASAIL